MKGVTASFDGTGAATQFVPAVQILDPSGFVVGTYPSATTLSAGATADVSWFPGVNESLTLVQPIGFQVIYDFTVTSPQPTIDTHVDGSYAGAFPSGFELLEIAAQVQTSENVAQSEMFIIVNNDTGPNYDEREMYAFSAATVGTDNFQAANHWVVGIAGSQAGIVYPSLLSIDIPNYAATTFFKIASGQLATPATTATNNAIGVESFGWRSSAAVSRIGLSIQTVGANFLVGSRLTIWAR